MHFSRFQFTLLLICFTCFEIQGESPCGFFYPYTTVEDWGIGAYQIPNDFCMEIYDGPDLKKCVGELIKKQNFLKIIPFKHSIAQQITVEDRTWIGHSSVDFLKVYAFNGNSIRIFSRNTTAGLYLIKDNMEGQTKFYKYSELLFKWNLPTGSNAKLGVNLSSGCLNTRIGPSIKDAVVECLEGNQYNKDDYTELKIVKVKGKWAIVEVINYRLRLDGNEETDCNYEVIGRRFGWLKAIADNGFPNIWYSVSGY